MYRIFLIAIIILLTSKESCNSQDVGTDRNKIFRTYIDSGFSGAAIVLKNDKVVQQKAYGHANEEKKITNTVKSLLMSPPLSQNYSI